MWWSLKVVAGNSADRGEGMREHCLQSIKI